MVETARDVMTDSVVSVDPGTPLVDVLRLFVEEEIHGAPVVSEDERLLGVISTTDLLRAQQDGRDTAYESTDAFHELPELPEAARALGEFEDRLPQRTAAEVMTKAFVAVEADTPVPEVARCLRENRIHRVWVVDGARLCGVVSTLDLMPLIERSGA